MVTTNVLRAKSSHLDFINYILEESSISRHINDDISIKSLGIVRDHTHFIIVEEDNTPTGLFLAVPINSVTVDIHTCIRDCKEKMTAGVLGIELLRGEGIICATSHIPEYNTAALKYSLRCGFQKCGFIPKSYLFNGVAIGQHLVYKNLGV